MDEFRDRSKVLGFLVDHHRSSNTAIRMAAAGDLTPFGVYTVGKVSQIGERRHHGEGEPVAQRFRHSGLFFDIVGQVGKGITLTQAPFFSDLFIPAGEGDGLKCHEGNFLGIVNSEADYRTYLVVVDVIDQGGDQYDFGSRFMDILDSLQFDIKKVSDMAMGVGVVPDSVKLKVDKAKYFLKPYAI